MAGGSGYGWDMTFAAVVWHYWLAVPLAVSAVLMIVALAVGYAKQVSSQRYPKKPQ